MKGLAPSHTMGEKCMLGEAESGCHLFSLGSHSGDGRIGEDCGGVSGWTWGQVECGGCGKGVNCMWAVLGP